MSQFECKNLSYWFNRILHSHFSFYSGTHYIANKNVKHTKTATGHVQTFHTYVLSKSFIAVNQNIAYLKGDVKGRVGRDVISQTLKQSQ